MSVDYYAHAVIGCEIPIEKLYRTEVIKHTEHGYLGNAKFCPICGAKAEEVKSEPIFDEGEVKLGEFNIIWSTDKERAFIGWCVEADDDAKMVELPDIKALRHELAVTLANYGSDLWNSEAFGLWAVLYCSY